MSGQFTVTAQQLHRQLGQILAAPVLRDEAKPLEMVRAAHEIEDGVGTLMAAAVALARTAGRTWQEIGEVLGVSRQAAFQRYGKPLEPRTGGDMNTTPLPEAGELTRAVIDDLAHARWADVSARFDATMRDGLTDEGLAGGWAQIVESNGAYKSYGETESVRDGEFTTTDTPVNFENDEIVVARIAFRDDQTIAGLFLLDRDYAARTRGPSAT